MATETIVQEVAVTPKSAVERALDVLDLITETAAHIEIDGSVMCAVEGFIDEAETEHGNDFVESWLPDDPDMVLAVRSQPPRRRASLLVRAIRMQAQRRMETEARERARDNAVLASLRTPVQWIAPRGGQRRPVMRQGKTERKHAAKARRENANKRS